jgi:hypothetical protein
MPSSFAITAATNSLQLNSRRSGQASFTVFNGSGRRARGRANIVPLQNSTHEWYSLNGDTERAFEIAGTSQYTVQIAVPPNAPAGSHSFRLDMVGVENPDEDFTQGPIVTYEVPEPEEKKPFPWKIPAIIAAIVLVVGIAGVGGFLLSRGGGALQIPEVAASSVVEATERLTGAGFVVAGQTQEEPSDAVAQGMVIRTDPPVGSEVGRGSTVTLVVSRGAAAWQMLQWEITQGRPVLDPEGKYWEKYEQNTELPGLYLPLKDIDAVVDTFGDFLELKPDNTFEMEEGGTAFIGNWESTANQIILNLSS